MAAVIGLNDISTSVSTTSTYVYYISQTKFNDAYTSSPIRNDIGLIQLKTNVTLSSTIALLCLPSSSATVSDVLGKYVVLAGWGSTTGNCIQNSKDLQDFIIS